MLGYVDFTSFRNKNENVFDLSSFDALEKEKLISACEEHLANNSQENITDCLACLRILSRDQTCQERLTAPQFLAILTKFADLDPSTASVYSDASKNASTIESLKCLSNIIFKNPSVVDFFRDKSSISCLVARCEENSAKKRNLELMIYDMKLLFLFSAVDKKSRLELLNTYFASDVFVEILKNSLEEDMDSSQLLEFIQEMLKFLFNLGYAKKELGYNEEAYLATFKSLTLLIRSLLIRTSKLNSKFMSIISNSVNFLTTIPSSCYQFLLFEKISSISEVNIPPHHDPDVIRALSVVLDFLEYQLTEADVVNSGSSGTSYLLTPVLNIIGMASRSNRIIRKYFRFQILPPLDEDVKRLPEVGTTLRNRLCRRLTAAKGSDDVAEAVAFVIFVLCKESIGRAIKYSGFGNFAGFLARHGLMRPSSSRKNDTGGDAEDSSSSDSDTEEYRRLQPNVNPVTGRFELPKPNPMENMSEEQKEYEAVKLVEKIDQLQRCGLIKPATVGDDGFVRPVEHVLELVQNVEVNSSVEDDEDSE